MIFKIKQTIQALSAIVLIFFIIGCEKKTTTLFKTLSPSSTNITFANELTETEELNIIDYMYLYNGAGVAAGDINNDGNIDLYFISNQGPNKLYLNQGNFNFEDITENAGVGGSVGETSWTTGVTMVDINADGWLDIYVCEINGYKQLKGRNRLYVNNKNETFTESAAGYNLDCASYAQHATFFDYDKDGDLDMFLLNQALHTPDAYKRINIRTQRDSMAGDRLFQNNQGQFQDVSEAAGIIGGPMGYGLAVSVGDVNNDSWPDIYISNDFHENDYLYYNNGDGTFKENIIGSAGHVSTFSMGNDMADFNNDGLLDIMTLDMKPADETIFKQSSGVDPYHIYEYKLQYGYHYQYSRNMLQLNAGQLFGNGEVQFSEIGQLAGVAATDWSWSVFFADLDNSGSKDIFISTGILRRPNDLDFINFVSNEAQKADNITDLQLIKLMPEGRLGNVAYSNDGQRFEDVSEEWGLGFEGYSNGAIPVDLDNDGDLDIVINNLNDKATILQNQSREIGGNNYLKIKLIGNKNNPSGIGARVQLETENGTQIQEFYPTKGWLSSVIDGLNFGLGKTNHIQKLSIQWADGSVQELTDVAANTTLTLKYSDAKMRDKKNDLKKETPLVENVTDQSGIGFTHLENKFSDFSIEKLIPHFLSTQGPKIAVGDINGDGLDDFYIGGAKGQPGSLYFQQKGKEKWFTESGTSVFENAKLNEDIGAAFADVDGDKDLDLFVISGGSEPDKGDPIYDCLYLNDGSGNFKLAIDALPKINYNGSCVVPADFNADGYVDFFIGGRSISLEYGIPGLSRILINDGTGSFSDATSKYLLNNGRLGMVTDAAWMESTRELVVVGEWMPISIFNYQQDSIKLLILPNTSGWWNTVQAADMDNDGDMDFLVGNAGLNTNLTASPDEPLELYVRDYDGNMSLDPIMSYYKNHQKWLYPRLDELAGQIVTVKKEYRTYKKYAASPFSEVFPMEELQSSLYLSVQTLSSVWVENKGGGIYEVHNLPDEAQLSPIFGFVVADFDADGNKDILAVGNFYGNQPGLGKSDASFGTYLKGDGKGNFEVVNNRESGFAVYGETRDIKILNNDSRQPLILISRNNAGVRLFRVK